MQNFLNLLFLLVAFPLLLSAQQPDQAKFSTVLWEEYQSMNEATYADAYILLSDRFDIYRLSADLDERKATMQERTYEIITALQEKARQTQPPLLSFLSTNEGVEKGSIHPLWVGNMIFFKGTKSVLAELSRMSEVEMVFKNHPVFVEKGETVDVMGPLMSPNGTEPGLEVIEAPFMWDLGYTGYGQKVLVLDTGVDTEHRALWNHYYGHYVEDDLAWTGFGERPFDCGDHGTHVAGTIMGIDREFNDTIGVAFNALWMAAPPIGCGGGSSTNLGTFETFQWALNPDNDPTTIEDMPTALANSWGGGPNVENCTNGWPDVMEALQAAGVSVVFSAGNSGPDPETITNPKYVNTNIVSAFAVGNLNGNIPSFPITESSSRGPSICGGTGSLLIKPEVSAPGTSVRSCEPDNTYGFKTGTSMASPHVSGAVLLLREAFPDLPIRSILEALYFSAIDLGEPGEDNTYGMGLINVRLAYEYLINQDNPPTPPAPRDYDVMMINTELDNITCINELNITAWLENAGDSMVTDLHLEYYFDDQNATSGILPWSGQLAPGERIQIPFNNLNTPAISGSYRLTVGVLDVNGVADDRPFNDQIRQRIQIINREPLEAFAGSDPVQVACQGVPTLLQALPQGEGEVQWFLKEDGVAPIGVGTPYLTDTLTETTTFYADFLFQESTGKVDKEAGPSSTEGNLEGEGLVFDVFSEMTIKSVLVYNEEPGARIIRVKRENGNTVKQKISIISDTGYVRIDLDFKLAPDQGYTLVLDAGPNFTYNTFGADFPYEVPGILSINASTNNSFRYYFFYDWEVEYGHPCGRTAVEVEVDPNANTAGAGFQPSADFIDITDGLLPISFTDQSTDAVSWQYDFGDGMMSTDANPTHTYNEPGFYTVIQSVESADGCTSYATQLIEVFEELPLSSDAADLVEPTFEIMPNPVQDQLNVLVDLKEWAKGTLRVTNIAGQQVLAPRGFDQNFNQHIQVSTLPSGIYFLSLETANGIWAKKFVVQ